jgi:hypothetical protein
MTLRELSVAVTDFVALYGEFPDHLLGDFIDDFRSAPDIALVIDEPMHVENPDFWEVDAYLAAVAEYLCLETDMDPPNWVNKKEYFLSRPWFYGGLESIKAFLLVESPGPFRRRNIFVSENAMDRV